MAVSYFGYHYFVGSDKKHSGITNDPPRRETEHQQRWPGGKLYIIIGPVTEAQAKAWEANQTKTITPSRR